MHRACYNQLATTLQRYGAQQQQATPCACDKSVLYCVELLWKAPGIRHPSHLLVPGIARLLLSLFCFIPHKTQIQHTAIATVQRARYSQHLCRSQQQLATPCACGRCALSSVEFFCRTWGPSPTTVISQLELFSAAAAATCYMYARQALMK